MDVTIKGTGLQDNQEAQVDQTHQALRIQPRPTEHTYMGMVGGHYRLTGISGTIAASLSASSELFGFRWADSTKIAIVKRVLVGFGITGVPGTVQQYDFELVRATSWTANYSSNQTAITPATASQKMRTQNMGASLFTTAGAIHVCTTAGMTGSTKTNDTAGMGYVSFPGVGAGYAGTQTLLEEATIGEHPLVLAANEGFLIRNGVAWGTTATGKLGVTVVWVEAAQF